MCSGIPILLEKPRLCHLWASLCSSSSSFVLLDQLATLQCMTPGSCKCFTLESFQDYLLSQYRYLACIRKSVAQFTQIRAPSTCSVQREVLRCTEMGSTQLVQRRVGPLRYRYIERLASVVRFDRVLKREGSSRACALSIEDMTVCRFHGCEQVVQCLLRVVFVLKRVPLVMLGLSKDCPYIPCAFACPSSITQRP